MAIEIDNLTKINSDTDLKIYENEKSFRVFAGPGAGKTYLLIENIKKLIQHSEKLKKDGRKILCITYTNAAADEIKQRLGNYNKYVYVSTIHSFLYDAVLKDSMKQLLYQIKTKYGIELTAKTKLKPRVEGNSLLAMCKKEKLIDNLRQRQDNLFSEEVLNNLTKTKLGGCLWNIDSINTYPFNPENNVLIQHKNRNGNVTTEYNNEQCKAIKTTILQVANELDFDEILYWGYALIKEYKHIKYLLRYRFPYVLVDEYQDTNPIQNETIKLFADNVNVVWGVIGDLAQSIYAFQGATYLEFENFETTQKQLDYKIMGNRRSTQNIISFCSYIRQSDPAIPIQTCEKNKDKNAKVKIVLHTSDSEPNSLFEFDNKTAILCRSSMEAFLFIDIESEQKKALKAIADTYQYVQGVDLLNALEQNSEDWLEICKLVVNIKESMDKKSFSGILSACEKIFDLSKIKKPSNEQKKYYKNLLAFAKHFDDITDATTFTDIETNLNLWLNETEMLIIEPYKIPKENEEYYNKNIHDNIRKLTYATIKKMICEIYTKNSKIMTIHKAKSLEFDKVIVGVEPFSREIKEDGVDKLNVLKEPKIFVKEDEKATESEKIIAEYTRVIYVGLSRAINELTLYIKLNLNEKEQFKTEFDAKLKAYMTAQNISEPFYEFIEK